MRIYEYAKQLKMPAKTLMDLLAKGGFKAATHFVAVTPEMRTYIEKELSKPADAQVKKPVVNEPKLAAPTPIVAKPVAPISTPKPAVAQAPHVQKVVAPQIEKKPFHAPRPPFKSPQRPVPAPRQMKPQHVIHEVAPVMPTSIELRPMTPDQLAAYLHKSVSEIILGFLKKGVMATKNQMVPAPAVADLARSFGLEVIAPAEKTVAQAAPPTLGAQKERAALAEHAVARMPIIVVMGHVYHGKTTLLDFIRKTRVAAREKGGITQHLGAYEVPTAHGGLVFLDTPGHEAFSKIRQRGTHVADIAVLVVAADDSVKPQTLEALKIAKAAEIPIIVAVNKIDKVGPERIDVVKRDLAQYDLLAESWGGTTIFVPVSAKVGTGVDELLEILALQSQMMDLKADPSLPANGFVLESKLEKGRGAVATVICHEGTLKVGDFFVCGETQGKVTAMVNSQGERVLSAPPSVPVQVAGFDDMPVVGDSFKAVTEHAFRQARTHKPGEVVGERKAAPAKAVQPENAINVIVKADNHSSLEAVLGALPGLPGKGEIPLHVVSSGVGPVTEGDVMLAANTGARIVTLHVKVEPSALSQAQREKVVIEQHDIIYKLFDALKDLIKGAKEPEIIKQKIGQAEVRKVFPIKGVGVIAGCYMQDGRITSHSTVVVWRGPKKVGEGKITSLQRDRKSVKEVQKGFECAFMVDKFNDWEIGDRVEAFIETKAE